MNESEWLAREAAAGDAAAFGVLGAAPSVQAARVSDAPSARQSALADDLAQETFLEAFARSPSLARDRSSAGSAPLPTRAT